MNDMKSITELFEQMYSGNKFEALSVAFLVVVDKWKLNRALLAFKMGMPKGTFNNKLSDKHPTAFTEAENIRLIGILRELFKDLDFIIGIDFNNALSVIVKKK